MTILQQRLSKLQVYNPGQIATTFAAVRSMQDCMALQREGEPVLLTMARQSEKARTSVQATLALNLIELNKFLHLKNGLRNEECEFISYDILDNFGGALTFADVKIVLDKAKRGDYGQFYERLSAATIIGWFKQYYEDRLNAADVYQIKRNADEKKHGSTMGLLTAISQDEQLSKDFRKLTSNPTREQKEKDYEAFRSQYLKSLQQKEQEKENQNEDENQKQ